MRPFYVSVCVICETGKVYYMYMCIRYVYRYLFTCSTYDMGAYL